VVSAGPYASLHLAPDRQPRQHPTTLFLQTGCPSCRPTNSVKALKESTVSKHWSIYILYQGTVHRITQQLVKCSQTSRMLCERLADSMNPVWVKSTALRSLSTTSTLRLFDFQHHWSVTTLTSVTAATHTHTRTHAHTHTHPHTYLLLSVQEKPNVSPPGCATSMTKISPVDKTNKNWSPWQTNFRLIVYSLSSTNPKNLATFGPITCETTALTQTVKNKYKQ